MTTLDDLLRQLVDSGGTDLVVKAGSPPRIRVGGELVALPVAALEAYAVAALVDDIAPPARAADLVERGETDFAHGVAGVGRFRIGAYRQRGSVAVICHRVAPGLLSAEELGLPPVLDRLCDVGRGLVLVVGPAGSGVSTTMAALVDHVNATRSCHVVTVERPIEHLHTDRRAIVSQREVGTDTPSVAAAVNGASRQGADVIAVGEVADLTDLRAVLEAAELGALVLVAFSALSSTEALVRLVETFPEADRRRARIVLSTVLRGALSQRLLERADGRGQVGAYEVVLASTKVTDCITGGELGQIRRLIAESEYSGMQTIDRALELLASEGLVSVGAAVAAAEAPDELRLALGSLLSRA
ncbi:MAG: Flp pilus assembly complex ATPase component TadA [Actinomycetota bacterium]|nr:Flp pilus assembly complex ATPase component TadA [Acidimicrobiia bacterium]MDQ3294345.1 Flp pilus assembly complex ATPase component TadA [Actinomycetota bacterium]